MFHGLEAPSETTPRFDALIVAAPGWSRDDALRGAVTAAGGRVLASVGWQEAVGQIEATAAAPLILLDAREVDDERLASTLYRIDGIASGRELSIVAGIAPEQIDIAGAGLVGRRVELMCDPAPVDWAAAVSVWHAVNGGLTLHDHIAESEAARLARLNHEVARIADTLARLSRPQPPSPVAAPGSVADARHAFAERSEEPIAIDAAEIRQIIRARRLRDRQFGTGLFEDPAWDMMLDLFAAHLERTDVSVSSLCIAAAVPPTTALRWIARMSDAGLFDRRPDPFDRRRAYMALSDTALSGMRAYISAARTMGLPVV
ncbi:MAG: hypothetical protein QM688_10155 [Sphingomonas bacterium]